LEYTVAPAWLSKLCYSGIKLSPALREEPASKRQARERMLVAWQEGVLELQDRSVYAVASGTVGNAFSGISGPAKLESPSKVIGRSELLDSRTGKLRKGA
jgi:hypothetical protein